jgi:hypothetical protein
MNGPNGQSADHADDECGNDRKQGRTVADTFFVGRGHKFSPQARVVGSPEQVTDCGNPNSDMQGAR